MTSEKGYEAGEASKEAVKLLKEIGRAVKGIDRKVEAILDELGEHFEDTRKSSDSWSYHDLHGDEHWY